MNERNIADLNANDALFLSELTREINVSGKEIVNEDIDVLIFGEIDMNELYHSEK